MHLNEFEIHALIAANADFLVQACDNKQLMREAISRLAQLIEMLPEEQDTERTMQ